jgi:hypothetical protein
MKEMKTKKIHGCQKKRYIKELNGWIRNEKNEWIKRGSLVMELEKGMCEVQRKAGGRM